MNGRRDYFEFKLPPDYPLQPFDKNAQIAAMRIAEQRLDRNARVSGHRKPEVITAVPTGWPPIPGFARAGRMSITPTGHTQSFDIYYKYIRRSRRRSGRARRARSDVRRNFSDQGAPGERCQRCNLNWVETGAKDESTGEPIPHLPYKIFDTTSNEEVASGTLDEQGRSPRHFIPIDKTNLYVVFGTDDAISEAQRRVNEPTVQELLQQNAVQNWHGFPAGLSEEQFNQQHNQKHIHNEPGKPKYTFESLANNYIIPWSEFGQVYYDWYDILSNYDGLEGAQRTIYENNRERAFQEYQLATGAREATGFESFERGAEQALSFYFSEEIASFADSLTTSKTYDEAVAERRQIMHQEQTSNPWTYFGGEIVGMIPTIFIPVGGAAAGAAKASGTVARTFGAGARVGAGLGTVQGFGRGEGNVVERLDDAAVGAAGGAVFGGVGAVILRGLGVAIARGLSKSRIWARIVRQVSRTTVDARKFADYIFRPGATHGKNRPFESLGYSREHSGKLAEIWRRQAAEKVARGEYTLGRADKYGQRINVEIAVPGRGSAAGKTSYMNSGWMLGSDGSLRLATPFAGFTR